MQILRAVAFFIFNLAIKAQCPYNKTSRRSDRPICIRMIKKRAATRGRDVVIPQNVANNTW
jgi:hypothetical protein